MTSPDPFESQSAPALSFKNATPGLAYQGTVVRLPELVQSRDYESGELATWPDGNPKMAVVLHLNVDGEERALWAPKPSAMFAAIADAQKETGQRIKLGDTLTVAFVGEKPNEKNPKLNPIKQYKVVLESKDVFAEPSDPWAAAATPAPPAAPAAAPAPAPAAPTVPAAAAPADGEQLLAKVKQLIGMGLTDAQIAAAMGVPVEGVAAARSM